MGWFNSYEPKKGANIRLFPSIKGAREFSLASLKGFRFGKQSRSCRNIDMIAVVFYTDDSTVYNLCLIMNDHKNKHITYLYKINAEDLQQFYNSGARDGLYNALSLYKILKQTGTTENEDVYLADKKVYFVGDDKYKGNALMPDKLAIHTSYLEKRDQTRAFLSYIGALPRLMPLSIPNEVKKYVTDLVEKIKLYNDDQKRTLLAKDLKDYITFYNKLPDHIKKTIVRFSPDIESGTVYEENWGPLSIEIDKRFTTAFENLRTIRKLESDTLTTEDIDTTLLLNGGMVLADITFNGYPALKDTGMFSEEELQQKCEEFELGYKGDTVPVIVYSLGIIYPGRDGFLGSNKWKQILFSEIGSIALKNSQKTMVIIRPATKKDDVEFNKVYSADWSEFNCAIKYWMTKNNMADKISDYRPSTVQCDKAMVNLNAMPNSSGGRRKTKRAKKNKRRTRRTRRS